MTWEMRSELRYGNRIVPCYAERPPTLDATFKASAARTPDVTAVALGHTRVSYAELDARVERIARNLVAAGFGKGERLALLLGNCVEFVEIALAAFRAGLIIVPMNTRQREPEIAYVLKQCSAAALIYDGEFETNLPSDTPLIRARYVIGEGAAPRFDELKKDAAPAPMPAIAQEDVACLLYTSGTTGNPKGAMLTHISIIHSCLNFEAGLGLRQGDVSILAVPASHVTGLVALILTTLSVSGTAVIMPAFKAADFLQLAARERMSYSVLVPAMYNLCLLNPEFETFDLASWRIAGFGGAPMPAATIARLNEALPNLKLCNAYGATETSSPVTIFPPDGPSGKLASVGRAVNGAHIVVVNDDGIEVPRGETGELLVAGPMVVPGYWDNPEGTASGFVAGYWRSGDIGSVDADGYVYVVDRKKDMINRAGFKVYCTEVENVMSHHPDVIESAVLGRPDPVLGERVHAFAYSENAAADGAAIRAYCAERLSDYKVPDTITLLKEPLPRNANGKILKTALRTMLGESAGARS